jgi:hypothetical protein
MDLYDLRSLGSQEKWRRICVRSDLSLPQRNLPSQPNRFHDRRVLLAPETALLTHRATLSDVG